MAATKSKDESPVAVVGRTELICVGTKRDGTKSIRSMIRHIYDRDGQRLVVREYCSRDSFEVPSRVSPTESHPA